MCIHEHPGIRENYIFPIKNYTKEVATTIPIDILALNAIHEMMILAEETMDEKEEVEEKEVKRVDEDELVLADW